MGKKFNYLLGVLLTIILGFLMLEIAEKWFQYVLAYSCFLLAGMHLKVFINGIK